MAVVGGMNKVFEVGPVFRAEKSNTGRHLCEFTGLDIEMVFEDHYFEVTEVMNSMFTNIFRGLNERCKKEIEVVNAQYPFEPFVWCDKLLRIEFTEGCRLLAEKGINQDPIGDLDTETEKALGDIVKEKYNTDFFCLYRYPKEVRPFYAMVDPVDDRYTNSYDFFMRGEEITSGAQRVHDSDVLVERIKEKGVDPTTV